jgi:glycosyltransferase involved in cell wall biosynthesis
MAPSSPLVSVITPTFNRPEFLPRALESLRAQTLDDFEVIVVNDAGLPVEEISLAHGPHERLTYLRLGRNVDRAAARNAALRLARGRYVAYLDDDDSFDPHHLATLVGALQSGARVAYSDARRIREVRRDGAYVSIGEDVPYSREFDRTQLLLTNYIPITCVMHERGLLDETGSFDDSLRVLEDWDLWIRMAIVTPFVHVREVTCSFSSRSDGSSTTSESSSLFKKVEQRIFLRYLDHVRAVPGAHDALRRYQRTYLEELVKHGEFIEAANLLGEFARADPQFVARDLVRLAEELASQLERAAAKSVS